MEFRNRSYGIHRMQVNFIQNKIVEESAHQSPRTEDCRE